MWYKQEKEQIIVVAQGTTNRDLWNRSCEDGPQDIRLCE